MKRMSDVFELPLQTVFTGKCFHVKTNPTDAAELETDCPVNAWAASHAINNCDALADVLECIVMNAEDRAFEYWIDKYHPYGDVSEIQYKFEQSSEFEDFMDEFRDARKALDTYRGAK